MDCVKQQKTFRGTGDNLDFRELRHDITSQFQNKDLHYFATNLIVNRLEFPQLSNNAKRRPLNELSLATFLPSDDELQVFRENSKVLVTRVIVEFLECFRFLKNIVPEHILHPYSNQMAVKSIMCSMPVLFYSENEYAEVVQIMRTYERWIRDIYKKAGMLNEEIEDQDMADLLDLVESQSSRPDQPQSHRVAADPQDPLRGITVPFGGDQLTRVRFAGARDLVAGNHTATQRFDHTVPYTCELWHTKASFLQVSKRSSKNLFDSIQPYKFLTFSAFISRGGGGGRFHSRVTGEEGTFKDHISGEKFRKGYVNFPKKVPEKVTMSGRNSIQRQLY